MRTWLKLAGAFLLGAILVGGIGEAANTQFVTVIDGTTGSPAGVTSGSLLVTCTSGCSGGSGGGGTSSNYGAAFPTAGTAIGVKNGANMVNLTADGSSNLNVDLATALPPGSNTIGAVTQAGTWNIGSITTLPSLPAGSNTIGNVGLVAGSALVGGVNLVDSGGTNKASISAAGALKVDASGSTQPVSGTVTANQGGAPWTQNLTQVGGSAVALGQTTMAASLPVAIASNQGAVPASQSGTWNVGLSAGSNVIGKVGIDQTTDVTTNGVEIAPTAGSAAAIAPSSTSSVASSVVLKASAGNLYDFQATSGSTAGYVMIFNATSAPADGTVTPAKCYVLPANSTISGSWNPGPALALSTGITLVFSSTGCFTKTASATAFLSGEAK